jgi:hypothetical protein
LNDQEYGIEDSVKSNTTGAITRFRCLKETDLFRVDETTRSGAAHLSIRKYRIVAGNMEIDRFAGKEDASAFP